MGHAIHSYDAPPPPIRRDWRCKVAARVFRVPQLLPNLIASELTAVDYSALEARCIHRALADRAHLRRVSSITGSDIVGRRGGNYHGIAIPYFLPGSSQARDAELQRLLKTRVSIQALQN